MEVNDVKQDMVVVYLKNALPNSVNDTLEYDRCIVRKWITNNSSVENWMLIVNSIIPHVGTWREHMDEIFEKCKDYKYFLVIVGIGCHSSKYLVDLIASHVEKPSHLTLLGICDKINLQPATFIPLPAVTINLREFRNCYTSSQMNSFTEKCSSLDRLPNGIIELGYTEQLNVEIERRPETLEEKFNTVMCGGLSNLAAYWDITPIYVDPPAERLVDRSQLKAKIESESEE